MVLCPVVNSLRMLELLGQVCLVVVRTALLNLACWVRLSNYWIGLLVWLFVSGLIVLVWSALVQAVLFSLVWSVLAGLFWSISFGLYCSGLFSPVPSWQVLFWFGFSYSPCCVGSDLLSSVLFCSSPVYPFLFAFVWFIVLFRSALVQAVLFGLVWSVLAVFFWFGTFGLCCSGLFSPGPSWQVLVWFDFWRVPSCVGSDLFWYVLLCSSLVNPFFLALVW